MTNDHTVFGGASRAADFEEEVDATRRRPSPPVRRAPAEGVAAGEQGAPTPPPPPSAVAPVVEHVPDPEPLPEPPAPEPARRLAAAATSAAAATAEAAPQRAQKGWRGALAKAGFPVAPGVAERAAREELEARTAAMRDAERVVRQATWTRAVAVLIANPKGGTGKTPLSLLLGGIISAIRGGGVGIVEVSDDPGALGFRAEGSPRLGLGEFVRDVDALETRGQVVGYTAPQTSFASVIGTVVDSSRPPLTYDAVTAVAAKIDQYFEVRVMDSGNQPSSGAFRGAVDTADVLVIPVMLAGDSTLEALGMLRELRRTESGRRLAETAIAVVMDDGRPQAAHMADAVRDELTSAGVSVFHHIPYEPHIAARGEVTLAELHEGSTEALTLLAADVIRALTLAAVPTGRRVQAARTAEAGAR